MKDIKNATIYKELEEWAEKQGLTADTAIELAVERFYERSLQDNRLAKFFDGANRFSHVREQWSRLIGKMTQLKCDSIMERTFPRFNKEMARQENYTGFNNLALGYLLMETGKLPHTKRAIPEDTIPEDPNDYEFMFEPAVVDALKLYFSTCSLELTAKEVATAAATLANGGVCPTTQERAPMKLIKQAYLISYTIKRDNLLGSDKRRG